MFGVGVGVGELVLLLLIVAVVVVVLAIALRGRRERPAIRPAGAAGDSSRAGGHSGAEVGRRGYPPVSRPPSPRGAPS